MSNPGIDYGKSNVNKQTGIHYGVIPIHDLNEWAIVRVLVPEYGEPTCPECGNELSAVDDTLAIGDEDISDWKSDGGYADYACINCKKCFDSWDAFGEEPIAWTLDDGEYKAQMGSDDSDIFILQSPYYTHARFCSPCAPGAGYLRTPCPEGPRCYAFGVDWFDEDRPCPYPVYSVATGECLYMPLERD